MPSCSSIRLDCMRSLNGRALQPLSASPIREVAELATHDVPDKRGAREERLNSLLFSQPTPRIRRPTWGGPGVQEPFVEAIQKAKLVQGTPQLRLEGSRQMFRVVVNCVCYCNPACEACTAVPPVSVEK